MISTLDTSAICLYKARSVYRALTLLHFPNALLFVILRCHLMRRPLINLAFFPFLYSSVPRCLDQGVPHSLNLFLIELWSWLSAFLFKFLGGFFLVERLLIENWRQCWRLLLGLWLRDVPLVDEGKVVVLLLGFRGGFDMVRNVLDLFLRMDTMCIEFICAESVFGLL